jgi:hypothetical protein
LADVKAVFYGYPFGAVFVEGAVLVALKTPFTQTDTFTISLYVMHRNFRAMITFVVTYSTLRDEISEIFLTEQQWIFFS